MAQQAHLQPVQHQIGLQVHQLPRKEQVVVEQQSHLKPFDHQVAGQSLVFRYDATTICKSLIPRELAFYKHLPAVLKPHVPQFRGVVDIALSSSDDIVRNAETANGKSGIYHPHSNQRILNKVARSQTHEDVYHFILLENLVANYCQPCMLDLKVGTRQHGDSAPPAKAAYQVAKCLNTTSAPLGVRLCGMKVFRPVTGEKISVDKMAGRRMREDDFRHALRDFLFDGSGLRKDVILPLLNKLYSLKSAVEQLPTYRFFSCSLLIVYDAEENGRYSVDIADNRFHGNDTVGVRDRTCCSCTAYSSQVCETVSDKKEALSNSDSCILSTLGQNVQSTSDHESIPNQGHNSAAAHSANAEHIHDSFHDSAINSRFLCKICGCQGSKVDARLVDFAHSTYSGYIDDEIVHSGVDQGCLKGLQTLISIFTSFL